jgi:hypothetical protein
VVNVQNEIACILISLFIDLEFKLYTNGE